jgi:hypothetical protein
MIVPRLDLASTTSNVGGNTIGLFPRDRSILVRKDFLFVHASHLQREPKDSGNWRRTRENDQHPAKEWCEGGFLRVGPNQNS